MNVEVKFENVGRDKKSWTSNLSEFTYSSLFRAVKKQRALGSRGLDFDYDSETNKGVIYAGMRDVGTFTVTKFRS